MNRLPISPLVTRGLGIAERHLGIAELAKRLGATESAVRSWQLGLAEMPDREFLMLADLLNEIGEPWLFPEKPGNDPNGRV